jgi:2'-5' RNA ligase
MLRAFIAIEIPSEIKAGIDLKTSKLRQDTGHFIRWVTHKNIHLTLKFLGALPESRLEEICQAIKMECEKQAAFDIEVTGLGCFPNLRQPRITWVGLAAPISLTQLQGNLEKMTRQMGFPAEQRSFSAHLTIGRVREQITTDELKRLQSALAELKIIHIGKFTASSVTLFKSELRPAGPLYTPLYHAPMGL